MAPINHWYDRFFKIISIIGFFLILFVLIIILHVKPAASYEFSIYDAYPWYFWILLLSSVMCGIGVIIGSIITHSKKNTWVFGMCAILISNAILLFIPVIRGYYIYGSGDVLTHIGYMNDILQTSSILSNPYPVDHILGVIIHLFCGFSLHKVAFFIPPFFSFFYIFSMYLVGKTIFQNKMELIIFVTLSSILIFGNLELAFTPNSQAFLLTSLILYLTFKIYYGTNNKKYHILLILLCFLIVFYHPLVTLMIILILCLMHITQYILEKYNKKIFKKVNFTYTIFFMVLAFSLWSALFSMIIGVVKPIIVGIFGGEQIKSDSKKC